VTGFGLLGHMRNMLVASGQSARVSAARVPIFEGALALAESDSVPGGTNTNLQSANEDTDWADGISNAQRLLLCDAQTSGGMLIAVEQSKATDLVRALEQNGTPVAAEIGEVVGRRYTLIEVTT